jgi:hypothetical protein
VKCSCRSRVVEMGQPKVLLLFLLMVNGLSGDRILFDLIYARFTEDNRVTTGQRG